MRIGLTGGIASGKSTVARELERLGAHVIDADVLAREVVEPGTRGLEEVVERFGTGVLGPDGSLDRAALGDIVFSDAAARSDLNAIIHPRVRERARELEAAARPGALIVHVIPLLVETGQVDSFDAVVVVDTTVEEQITRLMRRGGHDRDDAARRVAAQASREERLRAATHVIDSSGPVAQTMVQVRALWEELSGRGTCDRSRPAPSPRG
ncbi:dephospho-CoA kinase [Arachnia propionica]|uniref:Dephospho-CoA kinase n=1 Tax=Arachnia propionica TaxID=1750 RepID=A0A3P1TEM9_9ACTN|nr:dephospho-CoA kinase [Arachnia propionica]RRD06993.1 dephospho-CoA kinase [Arachnia propionica]